MASKKNSSLLKFALLVALVTSSNSIASFFQGNPAGAQSPSPTTFSLPTSVAKGTSVRIDGSSSMAAINQALKQQFEQRYPGAGITLGYAGSAAALQAVADGKIDVAAIGRSLTSEERAKGLVALPLTRSKIAVIVSNENPFQGNLSIQQFAQIFRGEITDWSQLGGAPGPIRFIDRPNSSDTRATLQNYAVFRAAELKTGATATQVNEDSAKAIADQLGKDGISYITANQLSSLPNVRALLMHSTLPDDPRYPFSQQLSYVYKAGNPAPAMAAFLGYATSLEGQQVIEAAQTVVLNENGAGVPEPNADASTLPASEAIATAGSAATMTTLLAAPSPTPGTAGGGENSNSGGTSGAAAPGASTTGTTNPNNELSPWLWGLVPLGLLGFLVWWRSRRGSNTFDTTAAAVPRRATSSTPSVSPTSNQGIAVRAGTVVSSDRAAIAEVNGPAHSIHHAADSRSTDEAVTGVAAIDAARDSSGTTLEASSNKPNFDKPHFATSEAIPLEADGTIADAEANDADANIESATTDSTPETVPSANTDPQAASRRMGLADAALLGGAALATGTAARVMRSGTPSDPVSTGSTPLNLPNNNDPLNNNDSLTSFDLIEEVDDLEAQLGIDEEPTELVLDDASATIIQPESALISLGAIETTDELEVPLDDEPTEFVLDDASATIIDIEPEPVLISFDAIEAADDQAQPDDEPIEIILDDASATIIEPETLDAALTISPIRAEGSVEEPAAGLAGVALAGTALAGAAGLAALSNSDSQSGVEASKFDVGQTDLSSETLATVDEGLPDLPDGYGESRIVLLPRDPQWAYTYWDVPNEHRQGVREQGGQQLALRLYDVTDVDLNQQAPHSLQQYDCEELARDWYVPIPVSDRDYVAEIGYLAGDGRWLMLARSVPMRIPPVYPSDWFEDQFATIDWNEDLRGKTVLALTPPASGAIAPSHGIYDQIFGMAQGTESLRIAGSLFGSMQQVPSEAISSFVFPSGMGGWALPTPSGMGFSGMNMSGVGFSAGVPFVRPRKFWLVADAELIVYGATEPDATLTIAGEPVPLNPDGTFRFQLSFQDGLLDYPILAVASDGEQTRAIHLKFTRETPMRNTNPKEEATDEWQM